MSSVWRICNERYAETAFTGQGSRMWPGRWHSGVPIIYTATSIALAAVEVFVNLNRDAEPQDLICLEANVPDAALQTLTVPPDLHWRTDIERTQALGNRWFAGRESVAWRVPSIAVMGDWNVLLNPEHPEFSQVKLLPPQPFRFDPRMFRCA